MNPWLIIGAVIGGLVLLGRRRDVLPNPPRGLTKQELGRLSPKERNDLSAARQLSQEFHGTPDRVWVLSPSERKNRRFVVEVGSLDSLVYDPPAGSKRGPDLFEHESGDRGILTPKDHAKPLLAVDPVTRKPLLVPNKSRMRLTSRGLVG